MHQFYSIKNTFVLKCVFIALILFPFKNFRSQNHKIDSLIEASLNESLNGELEKFLAEQNIILKESKKKNYSRGIAMSYYYIGSCYQTSGNCGKALFFFNSALKEKYTQTDHNLESNIMSNIGNCYVQQSLYKEALEKYRLAIKIGDISGGDINHIRSINYCNIGNLYETSKNSEDSAYHYYSKAYYYLKKSSKNKQTNK